ncbi:ribonuclease 3 [Clostridia bacterium]|nr:ribonuclease 3 [Clostridia bacterium]
MTKNFTGNKMENPNITYKFRNKLLLKEALTHSSAGVVSGGQRFCNERLEFLGDSVLQVITSEYLFSQLKTIPEGDLTKLRASIVCEQSLFGFANKIGLGNSIILSRGEEATGGRTRKSILADAFEALLAAIYLDGGMESVKDFLIPFFPDKDALSGQKHLTGDYKTLLQEIIQKNPEEKVEYVITGEDGVAHRKTFYASVLLNGQTIGKGNGKSKKEAEQSAAKEAVELMGYK